MKKRFSRSSTTTYHLPPTNMGFTIAELLVVIVIIGIITAISYVAYNGVQDRAVATSLQSDLLNASDLLNVDQANSSTGVFPTLLSQADEGNGITFSKNTDNTYVVNNTNTPKTFCLTATKNSQSYFVTQEGKPMPGPCPVLYLDAGIPTSYPETGTTWTDLSGKGHNGTISGTTYTTNEGGNLIFNGTSDKAAYTTGGFLPTGDSVKTIMFWYKPNAGMSTSNIAFGYGCSNAEGMSCSSQGAGTYLGAWANTSSIGVHLETCQVSGPATPSPTSGWHLYTAVFNGNNTVTFYVDGASPIIVTPPCTVNTAAGTGFSVGVGRWGYYSGSINDIRVYNKALSADEVNKTYDTLHSRFGL